MVCINISIQQIQPTWRHHPIQRSGSDKTSWYWLGYSARCLRQCLARWCRAQPLLSFGNFLIRFIQPDRKPRCWSSVELRFKLQTTEKGNLDCGAYLSCLQTVADELRSTGSTVSDPDLVMYAMAGLGEEYNPLVTVLTAQPTALSLADLLGHLLTYDARLSSQWLANPNSSFLSQNSSSFSLSKPYWYIEDGIPS